MSKIQTSNSVKAHTQYYLKSGDVAVGVTTVLNTVLSKPALIAWAWNCGMNGLDYRKVRDKAGDVGTITHLLIMHHLKKTEPDLSEFSQKDIESAQNCMKSFYEWEKQHKLEPIILEIPLVSDIYGYGGTPDFIGKVDGNLEILDYKSGGGIYLSFLIQISAYRQLAIEKGYQVNKARILRFGKEDSSDFEEQQMSKFDNEFKLFTHCLAIYNLLKVMKRKL